MASVTPAIDAAASSRNSTSAVVTAAGVIAALYFGSEILIPIALAILLSFAMAPAIRILHKLGLGRALPVAITVILTFAILTAAGMLVASQLRDLSVDMPRYEATIVHKVATVKNLGQSTALRRIQHAIAHFSRAIDRPASGEQPATPENASTDPASTTTPPIGPGRGPIPVQVVPPDTGPLETVMMVAAPLLHPLSTAFIVLIFVIFILLQREDLRNRAIRLFGANDLQGTTAAINDGAKRLSRYLLTQCAVNASAGVIVGIVLWTIGLPSPVLLGMIFGCARFVPYIGAVIGAALPLLLATAVDPGWSMVLWTVVSLVLVEAIVGQIVEPFAYGRNTGLSPVAIIIAATFWTVLWGPVGLFLSTPLTVCLVVLGRHVKKLAFLDVLLGDQPPLSPAETFYQRLLANDPVEVADQAQRCLSEMTVAHYYDDVALPGLLMAQDDAVQGRLDVARQALIKTSAMEVVDDLDHQVSEAGGHDKARFLRFGKGKAEQKDLNIDDLVPDKVPEHLRAPGSVLCIGARGPLDDAAAAMLAQVFLSHGIGARAESFATLSKDDVANLDVADVRMICLSALDGHSVAFLRFILRRIRRYAPHVDIVVGAWWRRDGYREIDTDIDSAIHQPKVATFLDAVRFCFAGGSVEASRAPAVEEAPAAPVLSVAS